MQRNKKTTQTTLNTGLHAAGINVFNEVPTILFFSFCRTSIWLGENRRPYLWQLLCWVSSSNFFFQAPNICRIRPQIIRVIFFNKFAGRGRVPAWFKYLLVLPRSHINRRTQFENPVLEAKRRIQQQQQMQSHGLSALPLPTIYRGTSFLCGPCMPSSPNWFVGVPRFRVCSGVP